MKYDKGLLAVGLTLALVFGGCSAPETSTPKHTDQDLLIGYELLANTLHEESRLKLLKLLKKITFRGPIDEVNDLIDTVATASKKRARELKKLRELSPDVTAAPAKSSPIGDAITAAATEVGTDEMLDNESFNLRFIVLQAQATRMVSAMASAIAEFEPNAERKKWLLEVSIEYEDYRDVLISVIETYLRGEGSAQ